MQARPVALARTRAASAAASAAALRGTLDHFFSAAAPPPAAAGPSPEVKCSSQWPYMVHDIGWSLNPLPSHGFSTIRCFSPKLDVSAATACFTPNMCGPRGSG